MKDELQTYSIGSCTVIFNDNIGIRDTFDALWKQTTDGYYGRTWNSL